MAEDVSGKLPKGGRMSRPRNIRRGIGKSHRVAGAVRVELSRRVRHVDPDRARREARRHLQVAHGDRTRSGRRRRCSSNVRARPADAGRSAHYEPEGKTSVKPTFDTAGLPAGLVTVNSRTVVAPEPMDVGEKLLVSVGAPAPAYTRAGTAAAIAKARHTYPQRPDGEVKRCR